MTELELASEIKQIYEYIEHTHFIQKSDINVLCDGLEQCNAYLARAAQLRADAEHFLLVARGKYAEEYNQQLNGQKFNATHFNALIKSKTAEQEKINTLAERLTETLKYRIDSIRTLISLEKSMRERTTI